MFAGSQQPTTTPRGDCSDVVARARPRWHDEVVPVKTAGPIEAAIVNDYLVVVAGLGTMLAPFSHRVRVIELDANKPVSQPVDVVLYDTFARTTPGLTDLRTLIENPNARRVVVFTWSFDDDQVNRAFAIGAAGYLSKTASAEEVVDCLVRVANGERVITPARGRSLDNPGLDWPGKEIDLTAREGEILALITQGKSNREIAELLFLSINTIKSAIRTAYRKIGATNRVEAVLWGTKNGMRPDVERHSE